MGLLSTTHNHITKNYGNDEPTEVHIHKAPTDKSIQLLKEFEEQSRLKIVHSIKLENNIINGLVIVFQDGLQTQGVDNYTYHFKFQINSVEIKDKLVLTGTEKQELLTKSNYNIEYFYHYLLADKISQIITKNLMEELIKSLKLTK